MSSSETVLSKRYAIVTPGLKQRIAKNIANAFKTSRKLLSTDLVNGKYTYRGTVFLMVGDTHWPSENSQDEGGLPR